MDTSNSKFNVTVFRDETILFTDARIKNDEQQSGLNYYHIRHDDEGWLPVSVENKVLVNHFGTIISSNKLDMDVMNWNGERYINLSEQEKNTLCGGGNRITIEEYIKQYGEYVPCKVFIGRPILYVDGESFIVKIFDREKEFDLQTAYIFNNVVLPYRGRLSIGDTIKTGLYEHNEHLLMILPDTHDQDFYTIKNIEEC